MIDYNKLADDVLAGTPILPEQALQLLHVPDDHVLGLLQAAYKIRSFFFQNKVKLNMIISTKTGLCPEDCGYCAQSIRSAAKVEAHTMMSKEEIVSGAQRANDLHAGTYCIVASGRGPTNRDLHTVTDAVEEIKEQFPEMRVCACLGLLKEGQAAKLKAAGVDRYNHNINTSKNHHTEITTTHTYDDRINTIEDVISENISPCSGVIVGMKETYEDIIDMAYALKTMNVDSIPVNFLHAIDGTKLEGTNELTPLFCLKVLALFRFVHPNKEIRISGGREVNLRGLQPLGLYAANSIFIGDYLTTAGQIRTKDYEMIEDAGFVIDKTNEPAHII